MACGPHFLLLYGGYHQKRLLKSLFTLSDLAQNNLPKVTLESPFEALIRSPQPGVGSRGICSDLFRSPRSLLIYSNVGSWFSGFFPDLLRCLPISFQNKSEKPLSVDPCCKAPTHVFASCPLQVACNFGTDVKYIGRCEI